MRWQLGEPLFLTSEVEEYAKAKQEEHMDISPVEGNIQAFLDREIPLDWDSWDVDKRRLFWANAVQGEITTIPRTRVCIAEIWAEMLGKPPAELIKDKRQSHEIGGILRHLGWLPGSVRSVGPHGRQKCFFKQPNKQLK